MPRNREIRYEIMARQDGRWMIDCLMDQEAAAIVHARGLLSRDGCEAVRVTRERSMAGFSTASPVFEQERARRAGSAAVSLSAMPDQVVFCEQAADLYAGPSRRAIGQLLRAYLDRAQITASELLHDERHHKRLDAAGDLLAAAVHRIAMQQAAGRTSEAAGRKQRLDAMVAEVRRRAHVARAGRAMPRIAGSGFAGLVMEARRRSDDAGERLFAVRFALVAHLGTMRSFLEKLAWLCELAAAAGLAADLGPIDEILADIVSPAGVVQELLGRQANLGSALVALAEVVAGRHRGSIDGAPAGFAPLNALIGSGALPETRQALLDRLRRELSGGKPLTRGDRNDQIPVFNAVLDRLGDGRGGFLGGSTMAQAITARSRRLNIVGAGPEVCFASTDPMERLQHLIRLLDGAVGHTAKRIVTTHLLEFLEALDGHARPAILPLRPRLTECDLPLPARQAIAAELARLTG